MVGSVRKRTAGEAAAAVAREQGEAHRSVAKRTRAKANASEGEHEQRIERVTRRVKRPETVRGLTLAFVKLRELVRCDPFAADAALEGVRAAVDFGKQLGKLDAAAATADASASTLENYAERLERQQPLPPHAARR